MTIGIDAEPDEALPAGVLAEIAGAEELGWLRERMRSEPAVSWDRLLFSAKESVYKAWFPLTKHRLGFEDAVITIGPGEGTFSARLVVPVSPPADGSPAMLQGRWLVRDGLLLTAIAL
jgi:4'-phosphopantetheinyl transferase EntD